MEVQVVTGYIPIVGHPRSAEEYGDLGEKIFKPLAHAGVPIKRFMERVDETWLWKYVGGRKGVSHSVADNPKKNTLAYHCVQHQKFGFMVKAAVENPSFNTLVWIDYGIGHVKGVDEHVIWDFLEEVKRRPGDLAIPGCWPGKSAIINDQFPCWRFCGGVMVIPRTQVHAFYKAIKRTALGHVDRTKNVPWEVNTMAEAEQAGALPKLRWYQADHNETMFTGYTNALAVPDSGSDTDPVAIPAAPTGGGATGS